ncbi:MAG TPA: thioredoxin domain-containing protein [Actinomycetota bacterium]
MPNRLQHESSPYLLQHASNPVDWYPWGDEAWARAVAEDKPVLLSIGYASCHWCHVMERESFADPEIAALVNKHFISIKVDREERPDLDALYIEALQTLTGAAGWPLTLFLTPERKLFFGGSYFPPAARDELPSFRAVLESVIDEWRDSRRELERQAESILGEMRARDANLPERQALTTELLDQGILRILSTADQVHGGFGEAPKFPQPWLVELMLRAAARGPGGAHGIADLTLRRMARGGIYDQLGGGFHRYAVDAAWRTPRFEKMLSDNALLARLYTHAWQARHDPLFERIAVETLEFLLADLGAGEGGFFSGQDAESGGVEGAYHLWSHDELTGVAPGAAAWFGVTPEGNHAGGLNVLTAAGDLPPADLRAALLAARSQRPRPGRDEKILTSWNGLAVAALAEAGAVFGRQDFVEAAKRAATFLLDHVMTRGGALAHSWHMGAARGTGLAEDYVYLAEGLLALWEATFDPAWAEAAQRLAGKLLEDFWDPERGGLFSTAHEGEQLVVRRKDLPDSITPSPNGVASLLLQRLGVLGGDDELTRRGVEILEMAEPLMQAAPQESGTLFAALDFHLSGPKEIAVIGDPVAAGTAALLAEVWSRYVPNRVLAGGGATPGLLSPLLAGRTEVNGLPTGFVCEHGTCKRPVNDPAEFARQLRVAGLPASETVNRAAQLARFTLHRMSLLDRLDNPLWIDPLKERGFFTTPPAPIDQYVPGAMGAPPWPDSKYLARMAGVDPFAVHRVAMEIPETDNSLVHEDLADAALALPPDLAADFAARAKRWLTTSPYHVMLPKKLGDLVSNLATKGHGDEALDLARSLLELLGDEGPAARITEDVGFVLPPVPHARFSDWDYEQILKENFSGVVKALGVPALDLLCDLLSQALELSVAAPGPADPSRGDGSYLWRPAIEDDPRNLDRSLRNSLVSAVRDGAMGVVRENPGILPDLFDRLADRRWPVFVRIGLSLLRQFPEDAPGLAAAKLSDRNYLTDPHYSREYLLLARQQLASLTDEERERVLAWVNEGPDLARWDAVPGRWDSDPEDRIDAEEFAQGWSASRAALLTDPEASLDAAFAFALSDPPVDLTSPKQAGWLRTAEASEIVRFARVWREPAMIGAPTAAGLCKKLVEVVTTEPGRFASEAPAFAGLPDDELRALLMGLREATKQGVVTFDWSPVLDLLALVAGRETTDTESNRALRISVARLLAAGFANGAGEIPASARTRVWAIIRPIAMEAEPPGAGDADGADTVGPGPGRSVAAEGLQAVVRYALWMRRQIEGQPRGRDLARTGWEQMPEVREVLEAHLSPGRPPTPAVQAVFGQWFPWLLMLDPAWAAARRWAIFPAEATLDHLRQAAWDTYLAVSPVFDQVFELLSSEYEQAASSIVVDTGLSRPQQGLAEHLVAVYLRGRVPLEGPASPLATFLEHASSSQRAHALAWVGQMVQGQDRIPSEIVHRLQRLWESRLSAAQQAADPAAHAEELAQFGVWFSSGKFDGPWAVAQLFAVLELTGRVGNTSKVVERLKTYMDTMPYEVARCIAVLVANERGAITILGWGQDAQQMLSRIVGGSDARARDIALDLLDTFDLQPVAELIRWS